MSHGVRIYTSTPFLDKLLVLLVVLAVITGYWAWRGK